MKLTVSKFYKYCKDLLNGDTQLTHPGEVFLAWIAKMNFEDGAVIRLELDMRNIYGMIHASNYCKLFTETGSFTSIVYNSLFFLYDILFAVGRKAESIDLLAQDFLGNEKDIKNFKNFASEILL